MGGLGILRISSCIGSCCDRVYLFVCLFIYSLFLCSVDFCLFVSFVLNGGFLDLCKVIDDCVG